MNEIVYAIRRRVVQGKVQIIILNTIKKTDQGYEYEPQNLEEDTTPRLSEKSTTKELSPIALRRLFSSRRKDIDKVLSRYGMTTYDAWELLKRTKGIIPTDDTEYLTLPEIKILESDSTVEVLGRIYDEQAATSERRVDFVEMLRRNAMQGAAY